jgi:hypothetical protein
LINIWCRLSFYQDEIKGREKDRKLCRRRRRRAKLKKLKARLAQTKGLKERERLIQKINKISVYPPENIPRD